MQLDANYEIPLLPGNQVTTKRSQVDALLRKVLSNGKYSLLSLLHVREMPKSQLKLEEELFEIKINLGDILGPSTDPYLEPIVASYFCEATKPPTEDPISRSIMEIDPALDSKFVYRWKFDAAAVTNATYEALNDRILIQAKVRVYVQRRSIAEPDKLFGRLPARNEPKVDALTHRIREAIREGALELLRHEKVPVDYTRLEELAAAKK